MLFPEARYNCIALTMLVCILSRWAFYSEEGKQKLSLSSSPTSASASLPFLVFVIFCNFNITNNKKKVILSWFIPLAKCVFCFFKKEFSNIFFSSSSFGSFVSLVGNCQKCLIRHPLQLIFVTLSLQGSLNAMQILSVRSKKQIVKRFITNEKKAVWRQKTWESK